MQYPVDMVRRYLARSLFLSLARPILPSVERDVA